nr:hypothetical protein [Elizabethkingia sp. ASV34]
MGSEMCPPPPHRTKKLTATAPTLKAPKVGPTKPTPTSSEAAATATAVSYTHLTLPTTVALCI